MTEPGLQPDAPRQMPTPLIISMVTITAVWVAGAVWSFDHQRRFAAALGFDYPYLLPLVADGLPVAMACVAFTAALDGRGALGARLGTALAVLGSAASNGMYAYRRTHGDLTTVIVAMVVPIASGIAFEVLLAGLHKETLARRGELPRRERRGRPAPVPPLRPIRALLDPFHELPAWRRHVLATTDPTIDPATRETLVRLVTAVRDGASTPAAAAANAAVPPPAGQTYEAPLWGELDPDVSRPETGRGAVSDGPGVSRPSRRAVSASAGRAATRPARRDGAKGRGSRGAEMAAWAAAELDAGRSVSGAELDRRFGTKNYGARVLREVRAAREVPARPALAAAPAAAVLVPAAREEVTV